MPIFPSFLQRPSTSARLSYKLHSRFPQWAARNLPNPVEKTPPSPLPHHHLFYTHSNYFISQINSSLTGNFRLVFPWSAFSGVYFHHVRAVGIRRRGATYAAHEQNNVSRIELNHLRAVSMERTREALAMKTRDAVFCARMKPWNTRHKRWPRWPRCSGGRGSKLWWYLVWSFWFLLLAKYIIFASFLNRMTRVCSSSLTIASYISIPVVSRNVLFWQILYVLRIYHSWKKHVFFL